MRARYQHFAFSTRANRCRQAASRRIYTPSVISPGEGLRSSRKLAELASDIDDAKTVVDELTDTAENDRDAKLEELDKTLEHAKDTLDDLEDKDDG
jgi:hypothetical protein